MINSQLKVLKLDVDYISLFEIEELRSKGLESYACKWDRTHSANQLQETYKNLENGEEMNGEQDNVSIAGRIVARRAFGKLAFLTLRDYSGTIQCFSKPDESNERDLSDQFDELKNLVDIGDILGASGSIKRTEKGELSVYVNSFAILTKSLLPLPDKYHGLTHVDKRYRQWFQRPKLLVLKVCAFPQISKWFKGSFFDSSPIGDEVSIRMV
ncbi:lysine--tRNA ligase, chloroplastic/mitochondrial-like [Humulus lupulus]|uniref:lysine--tRNA ligase, chloroplastic/mitochondrial-like n=1 Tax=Humulus lupulus TaxID=3486 RepID=UPI002B40B4C6|nr:lysine--tRNA ligase, chloroplastic/mitochondrial-like [Humulus lupulus]